jgi:hypothetical protein
MKMNQEQKARYLDMVQKMFRDSAWRKSGAGVPEGAAKKNRRDHKFNKEDFDIAKFDNDLSDCLESFGFDEETKQKAGDLFFEAVEARLFHEDDEFRQQLCELLEGCVPSPFISNEDLDIVEILANRVADLEDTLEYVESENEALEEEIRAEVDDYKAHLQQHEALSFRSPKKSSIDEWMLESDERNADALFNEDSGTNVGDPEMRAYLNAYRKEGF